MRIAPVAQLDRVLGYEPSGQEFESLQARHINKETCLVQVFLFMGLRGENVGVRRNCRMPFWTAAGCLQGEAQEVPGQSLWKSVYACQEPSDTEIFIQIRPVNALAITQ